MPIKNSLTNKILIGMLVGIGFGLLIRFLPDSWPINRVLLVNFLSIGGNIFIALMKMLIVPIVLVSIVCGICSLDNLKQLGKLGARTFWLFILTTSIAIILAVFFADLFKIGYGMQLPEAVNYVHKVPPTISQLIISMVPSNPIQAMAEGNVLQLIVFAVLLGFAINVSGEHGRRIASFFYDLNEVIMKFVIMLMKIAPYGVFCLIAMLFAEEGAALIFGVAKYFFMVIFVLAVQTFFVYSLILRRYNLNPKIFFQKMSSVILFAFSVSSSGASIPITLETVEKSLGVSNAVSAFAVPLSINLNKNGSAIFMGVASVFIAHAYNLHLGLVSQLTLFLMTVLAAVATASVPGVAVIALVMVLNQLGLPLSGIGLIIGVDRLLDMVRTIVNVVGSAVIACAVGTAEGQLDRKVYYNLN